MQPLATLAGAACPTALVYSDGARRNRTLKTGARNFAPVFPCSRNVSGRWTPRVACLISSAGSKVGIANVSCRRFAKFKRAAAIEDDVTVVDLRALEEEEAAAKDTATESGLDTTTGETQQTEEEILTPEEDTTPKANVKFVLHRECHFGQQFNVVGEIPELGEWDPASAVAMEWSDGNVWSAEVAIPVGLTVKYKFLMTGKRLELEWQPGEDKVFETKDATDLTVSELWDEPEVLEAATEEEGEAGDEQTPSSNGVATSAEDSNLKETVAALVATVSEGEDSGAEEDDVTDVPIAEGNGQPDEAEESPELPVVDASLATVVAEVSGEVEDAAAAEI